MTSNPFRHVTSTGGVSAMPAPSRRSRLLAGVAAGALLLTACGGGDDSDDAAPDAVADDQVVIDTDALETDGLDEGQLEILDDVADGLTDEFADDGNDATAPWSGIRLLAGRGNVAVETIDTEAFGGVIEAFSTEIPDALGNLEFGDFVIDNNVVVDDAVWVSARFALHRVSLADGAITATVSIDDVLPDGEFGDITGDAAGVYALATLPGGGDVIADVDASTGALRATIDLTNDVTSLQKLASTDTHLAAAYKDAPGIPVKLIDRASGAITDVGEYLKLHEVHFVRNELWVVIGSSSVSEPNTYEKFSLDGTKVGEGTLPRTGTLQVFGDRAVMVEPSNRTDPDAPVMPLEVEPVGTPIEALLPDGMVTLTAYAEVDGYAISSGSCCLRDDGDFIVRGAVVDMASGEVVQLLDSVTATAILSPVSS